MRFWLLALLAPLLMAPTTLHDNNTHVFPGGIVGRPSFDVRESGAKPDDSGDDTLALRAAFQRVPSTGGVVFVPKGTYIVSPQLGTAGPMVSYKAFTYVACEQGAKFRLASGSYGNGETLNQARMFSNITVSGGFPSISSGVTFDGCTFDGNDIGNANASTGSPEILTCAYGGGTGNNCNDFTVINSQFFDCNYQCVATYQGNAHRFINNKFYKAGATNNSDTLQVNGGQDIVIQGNVLENVDEGIVIQHATGTGTSRIAGRATINGNVIATLAAGEKCTASGQPWACCTAKGTGSNADECMTFNPTGSSIIVVAQDVTISNNVLIAADQISVEGSRGFTVKNITVKGNVIQAPTANGIRIAAVTQDVTDVLLQGNVIEDPPAAGSSGIQISVTATNTVSDLLITGNSVSGACVSGTCGGIFFDTVASGQTTTSVVIADNRVADSAGGPGIRLEGPVADVRIKNNVFADNQGIITQAVAAATIAEWSDNSCTGTCTNSGTITITEADKVPATDTPNTCAADRNGDQYYDISLFERCICNSSHGSGARWCQVDGGGCTSDVSCGS